jgi:DNA helicase HerA-like ATPase
MMVTSMGNDEQFENRQNNINYNVEPKVSLNPPGLTEVGHTIVSDKFPITMDSFWFALNSNVVINPFDFVTAENFHDTRTIGIVKELRTITIDSYSSSLHNNLKEQDLSSSPTAATPTTNTTTAMDYLDRQQLQPYAIPSSLSSYGITIAKVAVMGNTGVKIEGTKNSISISMPIGARRPVKFATAEEIIFALGIPEMGNPIPVGVIETTNGLQVPITFDISYLVGPDTAHVNASGISGNQKTTYLLFLLQSAYQKLKDQNVALIIFNTKEGELLQIDKKPKDVKKRTEQLFDILDLDIEPFDNVTYFLPRGRDGKPNSAHLPDNYKTYSYELEDIYDRLELLLPDIHDPKHNLSSIIDYIYESWPIRDSSRKKIKTWTDLFEFEEYPESIVSHKSSLLHFRGYLQRFRKSSMFIDEKVTSIYIGKEIKQIKPGDVFVIDVGMISSLEEQSFIVGDVMKSIDEMYSARYYSNDNDNNKKKNKNKSEKPKYILIFIDEINRFIPKAQPLGRMNAVSEQIMKTLIAGRSRGTILFSAQQFKSTTDYRLQENIGLHVTAKLGLSELSTDPYSMLDESTKQNILRLNKGELVMIHPAFRHPIKIAFPRVMFKKT